MSIKIDSVKAEEFVKLQPVWFVNAMDESGFGTSGGYSVELLSGVVVSENETFRTRFSIHDGERIHQVDYSRIAAAGDMERMIKIMADMNASIMQRAIERIRACADAFDFFKALNP